MCGLRVGYRLVFIVGILGWIVGCWWKFGTLFLLRDFLGLEEVCVAVTFRRRSGINGCIRLRGLFVKDVIVIVAMMHVLQNGCFVCVLTLVWVVRTRGYAKLEFQEWVRFYNSFTVGLGFGEGFMSLPYVRWVG